MKDFLNTNKKAVVYVSIALTVLILLYFFKDKIFEFSGNSFAKAKESLPESWGGNPKEVKTNFDGFDLDAALSVGSEGPEVEQLQIALNDYIAATGQDFSPLVVDGQFGPKTLAVLAVMTGRESVYLWQLLPKGATRDGFAKPVDSTQIPQQSPNNTNTGGTKPVPTKVVSTGGIKPEPQSQTFEESVLISGASNVSNVSAFQQEINTELQNSPNVPFVTRTGSGNAFLNEMPQSISTQKTKLVSKDGSVYFVDSAMS